MDYSGRGLRAAHFEGFLPFSTLTRADILGPWGTPDVEGVYAIVRPGSDRPAFIEDDHRKPRLPVIPTKDVGSEWVNGADVLYFGKAPLSPSGHGLARRVLQYQRCGFRGGTTHFGGRLVWRISDRDHLLICWKRLPVGTAADVEALLITGFKGQWHQRPFANLDDGKKDPNTRVRSLITALIKRR